MSDLTISIIQTNLSWEDKQANLERLEKKMNGIEKTELVILPEMFNTGFSMQPEKFAESMEGPSILWMKRMARQKRVILTGSLMIEENGEYFNRLIWMLPDGKYGIYDKRHLFSYAGEHHHYKPGNKRLIASVKGWKINLQVCYDLRFPVWSRQEIQKGEEESGENPIKPEYDMIVYVANWPERRKHAWKTLLMARAIENQSFVVGVNRVGYDGNQIYHSGDSMVIDAIGTTIYHCEHLEEVFTTTLSKSQLDDTRNKYPFWKDGDVFQIMP